MPQMPKEMVNRIFGPELEPDEQILWAGRPDQGFVFNKYEFLLVPLTIMWCSFAFFWEWSVISIFSSVGQEMENVPPPFEVMDTMFSVAGLPFCLYGLYLVFGRFILDIIRRRMLYYAVTDNRVIIISNMLGRSVNSHFLDSLTTVKLTVRTDNTGTIRIKDFDIIFVLFFLVFFIQMSHGQLERIDNVRQVYSLLNRERKGSFSFG